MGFKEIRHTADWALLVWGKDIESLFINSAQGMYSLMGTQPNRSYKENKSITIQGDDHESLLVAFLSELLFIAEFEKVLYEEINLVAEERVLNAQLAGYGILSIQKQIKAVTFHNLEIIKSDGLFQTEIVFDV